MRAFLFFSLILFCSCNHSQPQNTQQKISVSAPQNISAKEIFKVNEAIPSVALRKDSSQSFALFLPHNYSDSTKFPAIIFFDPHGDGELPLNKYQSLADEFGFVLIGSNNSKNGMSFEQTNAIANNLIDEIETRFSVDHSKISLAGFSGGAKVALLNTAQRAEISNVIYCGAAVPLQNISHTFSLLGFAGTKDMNYTDVILFDKNLPANLPHFLIEWKGKHEWTSPDVFRDAFLFLKNGTVENYSQKRPTITDEKLSEEENFKQTLINAFQSQNLEWWKKEIAALNAKKKTDAMYERLLGFISLACYSYSGNLLQQNNLAAAEKIISIYQLADPENKDCENFAVELQRRKAGK